jgi:hypothetical protein
MRLPGVDAAIVWLRVIYENDAVHVDGDWRLDLLD